jgi:hypothetical protein
LIITVNGIGKKEKERVSQNEVRRSSKNYYPSTPLWEGAFWVK